MYNKQILVNNGEEFELMYQGTMHTIPSGKFEAEQFMATFIVGKSKKWGMKVEKLGAPEKPRVVKIEPILKEIEEKEEETIVEETKTEVKKEETKKEEPRKGFGYKI